MDLVNQEKHGSPLTKTRRSDKDPRITELRQSLSLSTGNNVNGFAGFFISHKGKSMLQGDTKITISAFENDGEGNLLFDLDVLIEESYNKWLWLIETNGTK